MTKGTGVQLDHLDWQIMHMLQSDARSSYAEIGRQVHLSLSAVAERVRKLEDSGILMGYHAAVDPTKTGYAVQAFLRVAANRENCSRVAALAQARPEVHEGYQITGAESYLLKVHATSILHLEQLIARFAELGEVVTSIILSIPVHKPVLEPLDEAAD